MAHILAIITIVVLQIALCKFLCGRVERVLNQIGAVSFSDWWLRANLNQRTSLGFLSLLLISVYISLAYTSVLVVKSMFDPTYIPLEKVELSGWVVFIILAGSVALHLVMLRNFFKYVPTEDNDPTIEEMSKAEVRYWTKTLKADKKRLEGIIKGATENLENINNDLKELEEVDKKNRRSAKRERGNE